MLTETAQEKSTLLNKWFIFFFYSILFSISLFSLITAFTFPGNKSLLVFYCLLTILSFAAIRLGRFSYFYLFMNVLFLLGFWLKVCTFFNFHLNFLEPTGLFDYSIAAWNKVLWILNFAALGLLLARVTTYYCYKKTSATFAAPLIPPFYEKFSLYIWLGFLLLALMVILINLKFNFYRSGFIPTLHLPFKLTAIIAWLMNIGFAFIFCLFMWWDLHLKKRHLLRNYVFVVLSAIGFSAGCMSRGLYIYQAGHYFFSFPRTRLLGIKVISMTLSLFLIVFMIGSFVNFKLVMYQRDRYYPHKLLPEMIKESLEKEAFIKAKANLQPRSKAVKNITFDKGCEQFINNPDMNRHDVTITNKDCLTFLAHAPRSNNFLFNHAYLTLALQRWIGLEGLMAVSAWPYLNTATFTAGWTNRLAPETANPYPDISNAVYFQKSYPMKDKFFFSSLPGITGMLYYSGQVMIVLSGIFLFMFIGISGEYFLHKLLQNPFCESFYGIYLAFLLTMLGDAHLLAAQFLEIIITIVLIKLFLFIIQKDLT